MKRLPPPWGIRRNRNLPQDTEKYEKDAADICSGVFCIYIHNVAVCIKICNKISQQENKSAMLRGFFNLCVLVLLCLKKPV